jgi:hypothetical protein
VTETHLFIGPQINKKVKLVANAVSNRETKRRRSSSDCRHTIKRRFENRHALGDTHICVNVVIRDLPSIL